MYIDNCKYKIYTLIYTYIHVVNFYYYNFFYKLILWITIKVSTIILKCQ